MRDLKSFYIETFGCQMNKLDSELLMGKMLEKGYHPTDNPKKAGIVIFNTCSVRQHAEDRVYSYLGTLKREKRRFPELVVAVIGCMAQLHREKIHRRLPHVDIVLGTAQFLKLPELIQEVRERKQFLGEYDFTPVEEGVRHYLSTPHSAFISIIRGCDMPCTFCVVPKTRGAMVSRPMDEVIREAQTLAERGVKEITLLGQTVDAYGKDTHRKLLLPDLLAKLNDIEGLVRIRYITSHPSFITEELVKATAELSKVCEYLHMPAQSGSDRILKHMKRGYNRRKYLERIELVRSFMPHCAIASDFIVGYPGETEEDFQLSLSLVEEVGFQNSFIFKYSQRPYTQASEWEDSVPEEVKKRRNQELLALQAEVSLVWKEQFLGKTVEVLVDGPSKKDPQMLTGRTRTNDIVVFPKPESGELSGQLVPVRLERANSYTLYGELVSQTVESAS